ncbi:MAG TPA: triose-phosphate isomerase [Candidatus Peribacteraceae bacterium]|nr:triose-phosphate isomerase [Candidatus Peribacteraceae bacterium]
MNRTPLIAANWKMNAPPQGWDSDESPYRKQDGVEIVVFPTFLDIRTCVEKFLVVGAQCGRPEPTGTYTGDISMELLAQHGCTYVLCGHSERRSHHQESDAFVALQVKAAMDAGLQPILCIGESADERELKQQFDVVKRQLEAMSILPSIIAYEPVWAIGTGSCPAESDVQEMHANIRSLLPEDKKEGTRILYGGSVKPDNAAGFLKEPDVDGLLVGGASLDPKEFRQIVHLVH